MCARRSAFLGFLIVTAVFAVGGCASSAAGSNGGAGAGAAGSGGATGGAGAQASGGAFAQCAGNAPSSTCTQAATCAESSCGRLTSQLDTNGCIRSACTSDTDCAENELCFPASVVAQTDALTPRFGLNCQPSGNRCQCTGTDVRTGAGAYCALKTAVLGEWGCIFSTNITGNCTVFSAWLSAADAELGKLTLYATVQTRAAACLQTAHERYATTCP